MEYYPRTIIFTDARAELYQIHEWSALDKKAVSFVFVICFRVEKFWCYSKSLSRDFQIIINRLFFFLGAGDIRDNNDKNAVCPFLWAVFACRRRHNQRWSVQYYRCRSDYEHGRSHHWSTGCLPQQHHGKSSETFMTCSLTLRAKRLLFLASCV